MLKIKDGIDLKKLEEFGFKPKYDEDTGKINAYVRIEKTQEWLGISIKPAVIKKEIRIFKRTEAFWGINQYKEYFDIDALYDLIKADLVEKI